MVRRLPSVNHGGGGRKRRTDRAGDEPNAVQVLDLAPRPFLLDLSVRADLGDRDVDVAAKFSLSPRPRSEVRRQVNEKDKTDTGPRLLFLGFSAAAARTKGLGANEKQERRNLEHSNNFLTFSMLAPEAPTCRRMACNVLTNAAASSGDLHRAPRGWWE